MSLPKPVEWAQKLQAIAQTGLHYQQYQPNEFDRERYEGILDIAAEMLAATSNADLATIRTSFDAQTGHATPKTDVRGVVIHEGRILLVQETLDESRWTIPGGWADIGESPAESVVREVYEETGYRVKATRLLALYDRNKHDHPPIPYHAYKAFFLCELTVPERELDLRSAGGSFSETGDVGWFSEDAIPEPLSILRVNRTQISRFFALQRHPELPTDFD